MGHVTTLEDGRMFKRAENWG